MTARLSRTFAVLLLVLMCLTAAVPTPAQPLEPQIEIPVLGLQTSIVMAPIVYPTWDVSHLGERIGYLEGTAWFGEAGNIVLAGHATDAELNPSILYALDTLEPGAVIRVTVGGIERQYVVTGRYRVADNDMSLVLPTPYEQLTILTCAVDSWNGVLFTERIIVVALPA
jgi:LPXTG-site transpeptidase (sortase) family protein